MNNKDMLEAHNKINESTGKISNFKNNQNKKNFIIFQHAFEKKKQTNEISFFSPDGRRTQTTAKQTTSNQTGTSNKTGTSNQTTLQPSKKFWSFGKVGNSWESNSFLLIVNSIMFYLFIFFFHSRLNHFHMNRKSTVVRTTSTHCWNTGSVLLTMTSSQLFAPSKDPYWKTKRTADICIFFCFFPVFVHIPCSNFKNAYLHYVSILFVKYFH